MLVLQSAKRSNAELTENISQVLRQRRRRGGWWGEENAEIQPFVVSGLCLMLDNWFWRWFVSHAGSFLFWIITCVYTAAVW